ncbi:MAG: OmpP1/FadL family transporter [Bradymonadia bacterium]
MRYPASLRVLTPRPSWVTVAMTLTMASPVWANGFNTEYPDNGARALGRAGAFTAKADDPTAIYYNPAGLALQGPGLRLTVSANIVDLTHRFTPAATEDVVPRTRIEFETAEQNAPAFIAPFIAGQFGFEELPDWGFGFGIYGPAAHGNHRFPNQWTVKGATNTRTGADVSDDLAGNRDATLFPNGLVMETELLQMFPTLSAAWRPIKELSVGVSLQNSMVFATIRKGAGGVAPSEVELEFEDWFAPTATIGVHYAPTPSMQFGLSVRPGFRHEASGEARLRLFAECPNPDANGACTGEPTIGSYPYAGELTPENADGTPNNDITFSFDNPTVVRAGVRYVHRDDRTQEEIFDIEFDYVFEANSVHQGYEVEFEAQQVDLILANGGSIPDVPLPSLTDRRNYQDSHSFRLGGDWQVMPGELTVRLGASYETGASPEEFSHLDFPGLDLASGHIGAGYVIGPVTVDVGYAYVHMFSRSVDNSEAGIIDIQQPDESQWVPAGNGDFDGHYHVFGLSATTDL